MFDSVEDALADIAQGKFVVVSDDEDRENEGDLICAAELVTPEMLNFMVTQARGWVCLSITQEKARSLNLPLMVENNTESQQTAFTITVDADKKFGVTTGISASDRATTIRVAVAPDAKPEDLRRPGHISPLVARDGGVLRRAGHTEAAVDLARMAGLTPAGVICEILNEDGTMARVPHLKEFARRNNLKFINIAQLIAYRLKQERFVKRETVVRMPSAFGDFNLYCYRNTLDDSCHLALVKGDITGKENVLIRVHSECLTGDVFASLRCDCGPQLEGALALIQKEESGVLVYLRQEGRGIGLINKLKAYALQEQGQDTVEANESLGFKPDLRDYGVGAQILCDLGLTSVKIITNNPRKIVGLEGYGLEITDRVSLPPACNSHNMGYLLTKKEKMGHWLDDIKLTTQGENE
ncbi:bifunctional 3,4-dihydroxy-2-butanone-4-phosphate synthase/GTP cyclohydrolase II [bacterium]|nr:bifunctional 3,4-dihydroxy-2-butanone-4-phosphate synthase/GTP cyclohydrolase II [bacterium]QQR60234.1 MAG: bifunctional 3,4-dihydroxy-2-butanone-4-phosphate synthase/GTP cyclohydrolase II [Candidatus Melainabacteria bacterium]